MGEISKQLLLKDKENDGIPLKTVLQYVSVAVLSGLLVFTLCYFLFPLPSNSEISENQPEVKYADLFPISNESTIDGTTNVSTSPFVLNPTETCAIQNESDEGIDLLVIVSSSPPNFQLRKEIRKMWGVKTHERLLTPNRLVFVVSTSKDENENGELRKEYEHYNDILQVNVEDNQDNLASRSVLMLGWMAMWCPEATNLLKIEDDNFENVYKIVSFRGREVKPEQEVRGHGAKDSTSEENDKQKDHVTHIEYSQDFPPDASAAKSGGARASSQRQPHSSQQEAYLMALCVNRVKEYLNHQQQFVRFPPPFSFFGMPMFGPRNAFDMWQAMMGNNAQLSGNGFMVTTVHH